MRSEPTSDMGPETMKMPRKFILFLVACTLLAVTLSYLQASVFRPNSRPKFLRGSSPTDLDANRNGRQWRTFSGERLVTIGTQKSDILHLAAGLNTDRHGNIFIRDDGDLTIKKFSTRGGHLQTYGKGEGQGPGEFSALTDFQIDEAGNVWTADPSNGRITVFAPDGVIKNIISSSFPPYRIPNLTESVVVVMHSPWHAKALFGLYEVEEDHLALQKNFGLILHNQDKDSIALDGWSAKISESEFAFAGTHTGLLGIFRVDGSRRLLVKTVDQVPLPPMRSGPLGNRIVRAGLKRCALAVSASANHIYVLTAKHEGIKTLGVVDVYRVTDGSYDFSFRIPEPARRVVVTDDHYFSLSDTSVTKWSLDWN